MKARRKLSKHLLKKSEEAFLLALEIFNKPTISYRLEAFSFFYTNAWELLLKAYLIEENNSIKVIYTEGGNKTISLNQCLSRVFRKADENPIKKNVEDIAKLRDNAAHLVIPELETVYVGLLQKGVTNYLDFRRKWFDKGVKINPRMMTLVVDFRPESVTVLKVKSKYGAEIAEFFQKTQSRIVANVGELGNEYSIQIGYKLAFVKKEQDADFTTIYKTGNRGARGILIEVPKDPSKTHPYRTTEFIKLISRKSGLRFGTYELIALRKFENISEKSHQNFMYINTITGGHAPQYSDEFLDYVLKKIKGEGYLDKCREKYRESINNRRKTEI